jgi:hypothetical protein
MFAMLRVGLIGTWLSVDGDIIHIYREPSLSHFLAEYHVHYHLESGWQIGKAEEHDCGLKKSLWGEESSLPLVPIFDADIIVSPSDIKFSEQGASTETIDHLRNEGGDILVLLSPFVDRAVVLYWS